MAYDCVIVGGGLAGLACANRAAELGRAPLVLEQGEAPDYPCNSRFSGGIVHLAFKDLRAPPEELRAAVARLVEDEPATALSSGMAGEAARALAWLQGEGARFVRGGALEFMRWVLAPPRPRRPGLDWKGRGPDVLLRTLTARLLERGGTVRRGARARAVETGPDGERRLVVETAPGTERIPAPALVIADGGFQGSPALVREHLCARPDALFPRGAATGQGDGIAIATALGAGLVGMDRFYGHLLGRGAFENEKLWPYPTVDAIAQAALLVDAEGRRFVDEGRGGVYMANALARLPEPLGASVIFDEAVWTGVAADNRYPPCMNPAFVAAGGEVISAASVAELSRRLGITPGHLEQTVDAHSRAVRGGTLSTLAPARTPAPVAPHPLETPPFRAIRVCAGITYTMGGIRVDSAGRALGPDGESIPGLYAIGSAAGGMEGGRHAAYLGGLAKAVVTALRAAEAVAAAGPGDMPRVRTETQAVPLGPDTGDDR